MYHDMPGKIIYCFC